MEAIRSLVERLRSLAARPARRGSPVSRENRRLKQLYLSVVLVLLMGWIAGEVTAPSAAERLDDAVAYAHKHAAKGYRSIGGGTIEIASNEDHDLPPEIIDARTKGQQAREKAIKEAIGKIFPKEGDWGVGGPVFPMRAALPRARPVQVAEIPTTAIYDFSPLPAVAPPSNPWIGPGDPNIPEHFLPGNIFGSSPTPEPTTWALMIIGFAALALRLKARRSARA
ncbi:MAG: PEP-CTERM sorting domain-containing protein [Alphaproteobacteria bacterium]